jgi:hypothetical protein
LDNGQNVLLDHCRIIADSNDEIALCHDEWEKTKIKITFVFSHGDRDGSSANSKISQTKVRDENDGGPLSIEIPHRRAHRCATLPVLLQTCSS